VCVCVQSSGVLGASVCVCVCVYVYRCVRLGARSVRWIVCLDGTVLTSTKVLAFPEQKYLAGRSKVPHTQGVDVHFGCFTRTKVQILALICRARSADQIFLTISHLSLSLSLSVWSRFVGRSTLPHHLSPTATERAEQAALPH